MQDILEFFETDLLENDLLEQIQRISISAMQYLKFIAILVLGVLLISSLSRFLLGKKAQITQAVASAVEIFFVYVVAIVIYALGIGLQIFLSPLPFVTMAEDYLVIYPILDADLPSICDQSVYLLLIAFLVNLVNSLLPQGKRLIPWFLLRILTVVASIALIYGADLLIQQYVPREIMENGPMILLAVLLALILLGSLKVPVGGAIAFLNPIFAALYTFFFANIIGRALAKALLTSMLIIGLVYALNALEIYAVHIAPSVLTAYIPLLLIVLALWYVVGHLFTEDKK